MPLKIPLAHDFLCNWCWVGLHQALKLKEERGVEIVWRGYELYPENEPWDDEACPIPNRKKPRTPSRFDFFSQLEGVALPEVVRPYQMHSHNAHEAVEFAKTEGVQDRLVEAIYRAYWERGEEINSVDVLKVLAKGIVADLDGMEVAIQARRFADKIVPWGEPSVATGVYNIPTFFVGESLFSEQSYTTIRAAVAKQQELREDLRLYEHLAFPVAKPERPYTFINMVSTIDGKTISGERDEPVSDLGSKIDHLMMRRIEAKADAVILGASTLRASGLVWNPATEMRFVLSLSGDVPLDSAYMSKGSAYVATSQTGAPGLPDSVQTIRAGEDKLDVLSLLKQIKELGVDRLLIYGGSEINALFLEADVVDELFWTIAPKIKLGRATPTFAGGEPLPREGLLNYRLVSSEVVGDEIFVRYKRG